MIVLVTVAFLCVGATVLRTPTGATLFSLGFGVLTLGSAFADRRKALLIREAPTAKAAAAAVGLAELSGHVTSDQPTPAPFSTRSCIYWHAWVERRVPAKDNQSEHWIRLGGRRSGPLLPFRLADDSGSIWIWPVGSDLMIEPEIWESHRHAIDSLKESGRALLSELGIAWPASSDPATLRVSELRLEENQVAYVLGTIDERGRLPAGLWDAGYGKRSQVAPPPPDVANTIGAMLGLRQHDDQAPSWTEPPRIGAEQVVVWQGSSNRPFVISDRPEKHVLRTLQKGMYIKSGLGSLMFLGAVYALARIWGASP